MKRLLIFLLFVILAVLAWLAVLVRPASAAETYVKTETGEGQLTYDLIQKGKVVESAENKGVYKEGKKWKMKQKEKEDGSDKKILKEEIEGTEIDIQEAKKPIPKETYYVGADE